MLQVTLYGERGLSGWWLLYNRVLSYLTLGLCQRVRVPRFSEIVGSLLFINHNRNVRQAINSQLMDLYIVPPLGATALLDYHLWKDIADIGYVTL